VVEERYEFIPGQPIRKVSSSKLDLGSFSYLHNGKGIHRYINTENGRSITLNLYAKPLIKWKVYDAGSGEPQDGFPLAS
jgi:hypothetical protein